MNTCKLYLVSVISGLLIFDVGSVYASPASGKWSQLNPIEKKALQSHVRKWDKYSEKMQSRYFEQASKEIERLNAYKKWFHHKLTKKERADFYKNKKKMNATKFRNYVDTLMKKHGMPE